MKLDPDNFLLATDYAQSFYGIQPLRVKEALGAWEQALKLANGDVEKQGIYLHLARIELNSSLFEAAEKHLAKVTHPDMQELKQRLERNLVKKQGEADMPAGDSKSSVPEGTLAPPD